MISIALAALLVAASASCSSAEGSGNNTASGSGSQVSTDTGKYYDKVMSASDVIKDAASKGKVGNWGLGNEYEIQALLAKYGFPTTYLSQNFDMDGFDSDEILLASAMTYNELGLVVNSYEGGYGYGDSVKTIDMNDEGVAMLEDSAAKQRLADMTLSDVYDDSFVKEITEKGADAIGTPEKSSVKIQLKWLPQAQFMGYYVAAAKGYYKDVGLEVEIVPGGGDIGETTAVSNGTVDFGVTWVSNLITANAGGMELVEVAQIYQRSGLDLVYKINK